MPPNEHNREKGKSRVCGFTCCIHGNCNYLYHCCRKKSESDAVAFRNKQNGDSSGGSNPSGKAPGVHQSGETNSNTQATVIRPLSEVTNIQKQARQALRVARLKQSYDSQYGPLFLRLKISDVNRQKFLDLLIERGEKGNKILPALQEKYKVTSVEFQSALAALNDEVVAKAASFLSSEECSMFSDYTNTLGSRMFVNGMNALYLADTPDVLTGEQTEKLINILKTKSTLDRDNYPTVSNEALILAAEFLNKEQLDAMKLQREQLETRRLTAQEVQQKH